MSQEYWQHASKVDSSVNITYLSMFSSQGMYSMLLRARHFLIQLWPLFGVLQLAVVNGGRVELKKTKQLVTFLYL